MPLLKFLRNYLRNAYLTLIGAMTSAMLDAIFQLLSPLIFSFFIDYILSTPENPSLFLNQLLEILGGQKYLQRNLWIGALLIIGVHFFMSFFAFLKESWSAKTSETIAWNLRNKLFYHLQHLSYATLSTLETGDILQRCTSDVDLVRRAFASQVISLSYSITIGVVAGVVLFSINVPLTLIALSSVPLILIYSYFVSKKIQQGFNETDEAEASLTRIVQENLTGTRVVKAFNKEIYELKRFETENQHYRVKALKLADTLGIFWGGNEFICLVQILAVVFFGTYFALNNTISLGDLFVFISYETTILWPVRNLGRIVAELGQVSVSAKRIQSIFEMELEDLSQGKNVQLKGEIEFDSVGFSYENIQEETLTDISFHVKPGQTLAILGTTGSGKSTLVHLLPRFFDYSQGSIKLDGIELKEINRQSLRQQIGLVMQEPFLFSKTIKQNIQIARALNSMKEIETAAKMASIHEVITSFDQGYETFVGEKGVTLSGGQKQRVAIARILLMKTPILIFDDSLSAVDTKTDRVIREALDSMDYKPTKIIVTQRISSTIRADKIIVLENGKITQAGVHQDLILEEGLYRRIYEIQRKKLEKEGDTNDQ